MANRQIYRLDTQTDRWTRLDQTRQTWLPEMSLIIWSRTINRPQDNENTSFFQFKVSILCQSVLQVLRGSLYSTCKCSAYSTMSDIKKSYAQTFFYTCQLHCTMTILFVSLTTFNCVVPHMTYIHNCTYPSRREVIMGCTSSNTASWTSAGAYTLFIENKYMHLKNNYILVYGMAWLYRVFRLSLARRKCCWGRYDVTQ